MNRWKGPLQKNIIFLLLFLTLLLAVYSIQHLDLQLQTQSKVSPFQIEIRAPGMSPKEVDEKLITPLEKIIRTWEGIQKVISTAKTGSGQIEIWVSDPLGRPWDVFIQNELDRVRPSFSSPSIQFHMATDVEMGVLVLQGKDPASLSQISTFILKERLEHIPGITRVEIEDPFLGNGVELVFQPSALEAYRMTPAQLISQLRELFQTDRIWTTRGDIDPSVIQWSTKPQNVDEMKQIPIRTGQGIVPLSSLVQFKDKRWEQEDTFTVYQGKPFIGIRLYHQNHGNILIAMDSVKKIVADLNLEAQDLYQVRIQEDNTLALLNQTKAIGWMAVLSMVMACLWIWRWSRSLQAIMIYPILVLSSMSVVISLVFFFQIPIHPSQLGMLTIVYFLHLGAYLYYIYGLSGGMGHSGFNWLTPIVSSKIGFMLLMTILIYTDILPLESKPVLEHTLAVLSISLVGLILGLLILAPVLSIKGKNPSRYLLPFYLSRWEKNVQHGVGSYVGILAAATFMILFFPSFVSMEPFGSTKNSDMTLSVQLLPGLDVKQALQMAEKIEDELKNHYPDILDVKGKGTRDSIQFDISIHSQHLRNQTKKQVEQSIREYAAQLPYVNSYELLGDTKRKTIEFQVKGPAVQTVSEITDQMAGMLNTYARGPENRRAVKEVVTSFYSSRPQLAFKPRTQDLFQYGITANQVESEIAPYLQDTNLGQLPSWNGEVPVTLHYPNEMMQHPDQVKNILVSTSKGEIPLSELADWKVVPSFNEYHKEQGLYIAYVKAELQPQRQGMGALPTDDWYDLMESHFKKELLLPEGYSIVSQKDLKEQDEERKEEKNSLQRVTILLIGIIGILLAGAILQGSFIPSILSLLYVPILFGLSVTTLLCFNVALNLQSFMGGLAVVALSMQWVMVQSQKELRKDPVLIVAVLSILLISQIPYFQDSIWFPSAVLSVMGYLVLGFFILMIQPGLIEFLEKYQHDPNRNEWEEQKRQFIDWLINKWISLKEKRNNDQPKKTFEKSAEVDVPAELFKQSLSPDDFRAL